MTRLDLMSPIEICFGKYSTVGDDEEDDGDDVVVAIVVEVVGGAVDVVLLLVCCDTINLVEDDNTRVMNRKTIRKTIASKNLLVQENIF